MCTHITFDLLSKNFLKELFRTLNVRQNFLDFKTLEHDGWPELAKKIE